MSMRWIPKSRAFTYRLLTPPATTPISLATVKTYLKVTGTADDALITALIEAATEFAEKYTKKDFINKTWTTFRDDFFFRQIELRRSPLQSVDRFEYLVNNVLTPVSASIYYNTFETDYSVIALVDGQSWPGDIDCRLQAIQIDFTSGFGATEADIPEDLKLALMAHIAALYENRGDCIDCGCVDRAKVTSSLPNQSLNIYNQYRILDIKVGVC